MTNENTFQELLDSLAYSALEKAMRELPQKSTTSERAWEWAESPAITTPCPFARTITDWETMPYTSWVGKPGSDTTE